MDAFDRRLIELNDILLKMITGQKPNDAQLQNAYQSLSGMRTYQVDTGSGDDTIIFNKGQECAPGEQGPPGPPGPVGPPGSCECECNTITVSEDYVATPNDFYIGVNSNNATTITLPPNAANCTKIIVKAEMGPPLGNRKITVTTSDGSFIDEDDSIDITVPYQSLTFIKNGDDWWIIN